GRIATGRGKVNPRFGGTPGTLQVTPACLSATSRYDGSSPCRQNACYPYVRSDSVIPPGAIRKRPHVEFVRPRGPMLLREVEIGVRDFGGEHEPVVFVASGFSQLLEAL